MKSRGAAERREERGQIIVLFALMLMVLTALAALLYSGASTLVLRRQLQNAGDAAALAAANVMENGTTLCNSTRIASSGTGNDLYTAAKNSLMTNLGWTATEVSSRMTMSCPSDTAYGNVAVKVNLAMTGGRYFGLGSLNVATSSTGINGQTGNGDYSVALLDISNANWSSHGTRTGCPSFLVNGGVTVTYEGSIFVDSTCTLATSTNGSVKAGNSAFTMTMTGTAKLYTRGEVQAGTLSNISPTPIQNWPNYYKDPLGLVPPCRAGSTADCNGNATSLPSKTAQTSGTGAQCNGSSNKVVCVITPGTYSGGMLAANGNSASTLLLRPGVYYIDGGGVQLKSGSAQIISIPALTGFCGGSGTCSDTNAQNRYCGPSGNACSLTSDQIGSNWASDCPTPPAVSTCGVLIFNASASGGAWVTTGNSDAFSNGSQGTILLRAYNPTYDTLAANGATSNGSAFASYRNVVVWQAGDPKPGPTTPQPIVSMQGGACVVASGTVYAPGAEVDFGGSTCGTSGGADAQLALQFICWDLTLAGNNSFYFKYNRAFFVSPFAYGLVQ
jgi:hypothetical protein